MRSDDPRLYYDRLGDRFDDWMSDYDVERRQALVFEDLLAGGAMEGLRVLEVGCGTGRFSSQLRRRGADLVVLDIGLGLTRRVAAAAAGRGVTGDATRLPFATGAFDLVVSSECIEHCETPLVAIAELCRVVGSGGRVCLTTPNRLWLPIVRSAQFLRLRRFQGVENWIWPLQARAEMRRHGLVQLALSGCHLWPFQLRFARPLLAWIDGAGRRLYPLMINFGIVGTKA
ncbi:MAG: methyltransferase domain-containing protein [Thermoanaerobaculia bacterium]|nr:methyltransferase domain-containing protein [Thermoanaerobaculia bacterium]